jgi:glycosyltransferase involved in cell wall biosynthesis
VTGQRSRDFHSAALGHAISPRPTPQSFAERSAFLFVGALPDDDNPNADALEWFISEVWPKVQSALRDAPNLLIAGATGTSKLQSVRSENIRLLGFVRDLRPIYGTVRIFISPHRYAAGIPYKVHEAAAHGVPIVGSELIREQLGWEDGEALLSAPTGDPVALADACVRLYSEQKLWEKVRLCALQRVTAECSPEAFRKKVEELLNAPL